jgi:competence protein ComEA
MRDWLTDDSFDDGAGRHASRVTALPTDPDDPDPEPRQPLNPQPMAVATRAGVLASFDTGRRGVRALAAVAAVVVAVAAFFAWHARPHEEPVPLTASPAVAAAKPEGSASGSPSVLVVSVNGRVHKPGLVRLPAGARVADALDAAGGALPDTDLSALNLARKVVDGEQILVGVTPPPGAPGAASAAQPPGPGTAPGLVNLNTATLTELQTLPGIGEVLAQRILDYRTAHGQFRSVNDLRQVDGIGDAKFDKLKDKVTV